MTINKETTSQQAGTTLQLKRPLLPIDEYSARQGLSRETIEECGKLGIVQIRRYKGKTFVVDIPISPYHPSSPPLGILRNPLGDACRQESIVRSWMPNGGLWDAGGETAELPERLTHLRKTTAAVRIVPTKRSEVTSGPTEATDELTQIGNPPELIQTPDLEASKTTQAMARRSALTSAESVQLAGELTEAKGTPKSTTNMQNDGLRFDVLAEQAGSKRTWQVAAVFFFVSFFAAAFVGFWLYIDWKDRTKTLEQAHTTIQNMHSNFTKATLQIEILKNERDNFIAELERLRNELDRSAAEVKNLQDELGRARRYLEAIKRRALNKVERLNEQIKDFTARLLVLRSIATTQSSRGAEQK